MTFDSHRRGVHRFLHQQPAQRPARRGRRAQRQQDCCRRQGNLRSRFRPGQTCGGAGRIARDFPGRRIRVARGGAAPYVSMPEARVSLRGRASLPAPTATLKDARVRGVRSHLASPATVAALGAEWPHHGRARGRGARMKPFVTHKGVTAPLIRNNIDTDTIIPSREIAPRVQTGVWAMDCLPVGVT